MNVRVQSQKGYQATISITGILTLRKVSILAVTIIACDAHCARRTYSGRFFRGMRTIRVWTCVARLGVAWGHGLHELTFCHVLLSFREASVADFNVLY